jgi:glutamyl-tRNA synthetase
MSVRTRFAPSPTGSPHVGNLRTAIYAWLLARHEGGQFLARLEDTDRSETRYKPESIYELEACMRFLGILPDESWITGGPVGPYVQSMRLPIYHEYAAKMIAEGHAYRCYCTKERLEEMRCLQQERGTPTGYDRRCRYLSPAERAENEAAGLPCVVRLAMPLEGITVLHDEIRGDIQFENRLQDDQVLIKSDGYPTYFLAASIDDHLMGITHIIRGDEWLASAPKMIQIYRVLGWNPPKFAHPPIITGPDKKKLSKRHGATQFSWFMEQGYLPEALTNFLVLLGWSAGDENRELFTVPELIERFSLNGISESPAVFDHEKLRWMNGHYIRHSEPGRIIGLCLPYLRQAGMVSDPPAPEASEEEKRAYEAEMAYVRRIIPLELERMKVISEVTDLVGFFFRKLDYPEGYDEKAVQKWFGVTYLKPMLELEIARFAALPEWTVEELEKVVRDVTEELGVDFAKVIHPTRVAVTGRTVGPGLFETLWALGRERTLQRLESVLNRD